MTLHAAVGDIASVSIIRATSTALASRRAHCTCSAAAPAAVRREAAAHAAACSQRFSGAPPEIEAIHTETLVQLERELAQADTLASADLHRKQQEVKSRLQELLEKHELNGPVHEDALRLKMLHVRCRQILAER